MFNKHNKIDLDIFEVQKASKQVHYTVHLIGNADDLARWKKAQEMREIAYQTLMAPIREAKRAKANEIVKTQAITSLPQDALDKAETQHIDNRAAKSQPSVVMASYRPMPPPIKKSFVQKVKSFIAQIWKNAFPE
jgi:hypothetical protein